MASLRAALAAPLLIAPFTPLLTRYAGVVIGSLPLLVAGIVALALLPPPAVAS
jgi:hypothetical protein